MVLLGSHCQRADDNTKRIAAFLSLWLLSSFLLRAGCCWFLSISRGLTGVVCDGCWNDHQLRDPGNGLARCAYEFTNARPRVRFFEVSHERALKPWSARTNRNGLDCSDTSCPMYRPGQHGKAAYVFCSYDTTATTPRTNKLGTEVAQLATCPTQYAVAGRYEGQYQ
jgi:hypothetical protein